MSDALQDKERILQEIKEIELELEQTMSAIKTLGIVTLELEEELEQSWDLVRTTAADKALVEATEEVQIDKTQVTQENVNAFMSSIE